MTTVVRIPRALREAIERDLERPHRFASERVGFVLARSAQHDRGLMVTGFEYLPVADERYIDDPLVGAKIDGTAIRMALQATLDRRCACLHVHAHYPAMTYFSGLDLEEQEKLVPSFRATVSEQPHGALLLHGAGATARLWLPDRSVEFAQRVVTVGFPTTWSGGAR